MAHILIVEDDAALCQMLVQMLRQEGHEVSNASDGRQALGLWPRHAPDLVVTDILMPNADGVELILNLAQLGHDVPVIAMSGGRRALTAAFNLESAALLGVRATLAKPFSRAALCQAIDDVLA